MGQNRISTCICYVFKPHTLRNAVILHSDFELAYKYVCMSIEQFYVLIFIRVQLFLQIILSCEFSLQCMAK